MDFSTRPPRHEAFILRIWQEGRGHEEEQPIWRLSLENPHTAERLGFKNLETLTTFLQQWMQDNSSEENN